LNVERAVVYADGLSAEPQLTWVAEAAEAALDLLAADAKAHGLVKRL
jgi:hypothetical protein